MMLIYSPQSRRARREKMSFFIYEEVPANENLGLLRGGILLIIHLVRLKFIFDGRAYLT